MFIFIANQVFGKGFFSGGDVLTFEIFKRIEKEKIILTSKAFENLIPEKFPGAGYFSTDKGELDFRKFNLLLLGFYTVYKFFQRSITAYFWLKKNVKDGDIIYLPGDFFCNLLPVFLLGKRKNIRVLANFFHRNPKPKSRPDNPFLVSLFSRWFQGLSLKMMKKVADIVFILSEVGRAELQDEGFDNRKIIISGAGINKNFLDKFRRKDFKRNQLVFLGRLNRTKGVFDLIEILGRLKAEGFDFTCKFVGASNRADAAEINMMAGKLGIKDKIDLTGFVSEEKKYEILSDSAALLLPSKEEGFGIVILEALALGIPVICYDLPSLKTIFGNYKSVFFATLNDKNNFADLIKRKIFQDNIREKNRNLLTDGIQDWENVFNKQARYFS